MLRRRDAYANWSSDEEGVACQTTGLVPRLNVSRTQASGNEPGVYFRIRYIDSVGKNLIAELQEIHSTSP